MTFFRKKYYREVPCKACDGKGVKITYIVWDDIKNESPTKKVDLCKGCRGRGTQTVLERVE